VNVVFTLEPATNVDAAVLAYCVSTDFEAELGELDEKFDGHLVAHLNSVGFKGKPGNKASFPTFGKVAASQLIILGVGDGASANLFKAASLAGRKAREAGYSSLVFTTPKIATANLEQIVEGIQCGNYDYQIYKPEAEQKSALELITLSGVEANAASVKAGERATIRSFRQSFSRDLINGPAADITPQALADAALSLSGMDGVTVDIWDFERCKKEGLVGLVAVGQGSSEPGCLIHISYRPKKANGHIALVGKGVTFDCGGLSIKPAGGMQTMRMDMGGAGTVLGATAAAIELGLELNVDCFVGAVENMIAGNSYKQGDILRYNNGVTVEIHNTDAEGRLVLADCLIEASKIEGVTHIVDAATLTGACIVAVGEELTALFTDDDDFANTLTAASTSNNEGMWRLPLKQSYKRSLKGSWGQIKNVGGRAAGSITAALFLQHFVGKGIKWAHLDIAGAAWYDKAIDGYTVGATGQVVRALTTWMEEVADS
jgi:leucyl aminopeptidase